MEENMTMITEIEENGNVEAVENTSTFGEKALTATIVVAAIAGTVAGAKWIAGKVKGIIRKKKAQKIEDEYDEEPDEDEVDSDEESN